MFDINRIVILILIGALLYALYMYQQQIPNLPFIGNNKAIENQKEKKPVKKKPRKIKHSKEETKNENKKKERNIKKDKTDLISIDNISQASLGSLLDVDSDDIGEVYKPAPELNSLDSNGTFGSLLNESTENSGNYSSNEDFFFQ